MNHFNEKQFKLMTNSWIKKKGERTQTLMHKRKGLPLLPRKYSVGKMRHVEPLGASVLDSILHVLFMYPCILYEQTAFFYL